MGAREVLASWEGWLMVSASRATSWRVRANSKMRSISLCTSADDTDDTGKHSEAAEPLDKPLVCCVWTSSRFCGQIHNRHVSSSTCMSAFQEKQTVPSVWIRLDRFHLCTAKWSSAAFSFCCNLPTWRVSFNLLFVGVEKEGGTWEWDACCTCNN